MYAFFVVLNRSKIETSKHSCKKRERHSVSLTCSPKAMLTLEFLQMVKQLILLFPLYDSCPRARLLGLGPSNETTAVDRKVVTSFSTSTVTQDRIRANFWFIQENRSTHLTRSHNFKAHHRGVEFRRRAI